MDILIKSFNRPYYLDRCLRSIYQCVKGTFTIKVLDDGTPPVYLERILELYPEIQILRSPQYTVKADAIEAHIHQGKPYSQTKIPTKFWIEAVESSTDFFLLLEDDIWLTSVVDIDEVQRTMQHEKMALVRLSWQGNKTLVAGGKRVLSEQIEEIQPAISNWRKFVFQNRFKVRSIGYRLGLFQNIMPYQLPMYVLYAVASSFFSKDYWLYLWQGAGERVLEEHQLQKALQWNSMPQGHAYSRYGKLRQESADTSYLTTTNNGFVEIKCDMMQINYLLNEAWLRSELDAMQGFPADFAVTYLRQFFEHVNNGARLYEDWLTWITRFKHDYRRLGCVVD
jgi:glycosyltransferase involved in cell wall biosynthesis